MQSITFAADFGSLRNQYKVLELSEELLQEIEQGQGEVCIKGAPAEEAVLCTKDTTYSLRQLDTSNCHLLLPPKKREVQSMFTGYLELHEVLPRTGVLPALLGECPYEGEEAEEEEEMALETAETKKKGRKYTWEALRNQVQASDQQLLNALKRINAFEWNGHWRLLGRSFITELMDRIITAAHANEWPLSAIPVEACQQNLRMYPGQVVEHCLRIYSRSTDSPTPDVVALDPTLLCAMRAEDILLEGPDKPWVLSDFMGKWKDRMQNDDIALSPSSEMLKGIALVSTLGTERRLTYLPTTSLPPTAPARFAFLFSKQRKWTLDEVTPYIEDLVEPGMTAEKLLMKYARMSEQNGQRFFTPR